MAILSRKGEIRSEAENDFYSFARVAKSPPGRGRYNRIICHSIRPWSTSRKA